MHAECQLVDLASSQVVKHLVLGLLPAKVCRLLAQQLAAQLYCQGSSSPGSLNTGLECLATAGTYLVCMHALGAARDVISCEDACTILGSWLAAGSKFQLSFVTTPSPLQLVSCRRASLAVLRLHHE